MCQSAVQPRFPRQFARSLALSRRALPNCCRLSLLALSLASGGVIGAEGIQPDVTNQTVPSALKRLSLEELSQIEVTTPSKEPVKAFQSPVAIYVITAEQIRRSGATSIPEALRLAPGVEVARIDANKWSIGIRGFSSRFSRGVLVLIDGRTVYSPSDSGVFWDAQDVVLEDLDRIEVIRGPGAALWGANAVNGVINITTKSAKDTQGGLISTSAGTRFEPMTFPMTKKIAPPTQKFHAKLTPTAMSWAMSCLESP